MIFSPLVSIPADDEPIQDRPKSHLITKKDVKRFLYVLPFIVLILYFLYAYFKKISDWHTCAGNMNSIYKAIGLYANDYDDRFPPLSPACNPGTGTPYVTNGTVQTWVTPIFQYDPRPEIYQCPAAQPGEAVPTAASIPPKKPGEKHQDVVVQSTYGMYAGYAAASEALVQRSGESVFLAETANYGSQNSYDPQPYLDATGRPVPYDGFSIGWNDGNLTASTASRHVTRLAFHDAAKGDFSKSTSRHDQGIHAIGPDGNLIILHPPDSTVSISGGLPSGMWQTAPMAP